MIENYILNDYFEWLYSIVKNERRSKRASYKKLLSTLHNIEFKYFIDYDENRAADGIEMRWRYVCEGGNKAILKWKEPCTVLEMILGLAYQMEYIMDDPILDYKVGHWFWIMISNLELDRMTDSKFNKNEVYGRIFIFLERKYEPNGEGNIIKIDNTDTDLRDVEIWWQMCWYLDSIIR